MGDGTHDSKHHGTLNTKHVADPNGLNKDVADTEFPDTHTLPTLMAEETTSSTAGCLALSLRRSPALPCWVTARAAPRSPPACRSKRLCRVEAQDFVPASSSPGHYCLLPMFRLLNQKF